MTDLEDFINYKRDRGVKEETLKDYRQTILRIINNAKDMGLNNDPRTMTEMDFRRTINGMNLASLTINTMVTTFKMYLRFIGNPMDDVRFLVNNDRPNARWIREDDFVRIFNECTDPTIKMILHLGGNYGLRRKEICDMTMNDISNGFIVVCGKGHGKGKIRKVPLMEDDTVLKEYIKWRFEILGKVRNDLSEGKFVVRFYRGVLYKQNPTTLTINMSKYFKDRGIDATTHSLRREFVTTAYRSGVDIITIQRLVGHVSPQTTEKYIENDIDAAVQAINQRSHYISGKTIT